MSSNRRASFPVNVLRRSPRRRTKTPSVNELPKKCKISPRGKRKLEFQHEKPLKGRTYYLDLPGYRKLNSLQTRVKELGGVVEEFLSKDISCVVTNRKDVETGCSPRSNSTPSPILSIPSPFPGNTKSSSAKGFAVPSPLSADSASAEQPGPHPPKHNIRGKALAAQAALTCKHGTSNVIANARNWGVEIVSLEEMLETLEQFGSIVKKPSSSKPLVTRRVPKQSVKPKVRKLRAPFIKVEDHSRCYKPLVHELKEWPKIYFDSPLGSCPFDPPKVDVENDHEGRDKTKRNQVKEDKHKKKGFCECCCVHYEDLDLHLQSDRHQSFARDPSNYRSLDELIKKGPSLQDFLEKMLLKHEQKQKEQQAKKTRNELTTAEKSVVENENKTPTKHNTPDISPDSQTPADHTPEKNNECYTPTNPSPRNTNRCQTFTNHSSPEKKSSDDNTPARVLRSGSAKSDTSIAEKRSSRSSPRTTNALKEKKNEELCTTEQKFVKTKGLNLDKSGNKSPKKRARPAKTPSTLSSPVAGRSNSDKPASGVQEEQDSHVPAKTTLKKKSPKRENQADAAEACLKTQRRQSDSSGESSSKENQDPDAPVYYSVETADYEEHMGRSMLRSKTILDDHQLHLNEDYVEHESRVEAKTVEEGELNQDVEMACSKKSSLRSSTKLSPAHELTNVSLPATDEEITNAEAQKQSPEIPSGCSAEKMSPARELRNLKSPTEMEEGNSLELEKGSPRRRSLRSALKGSPAGKLKSSESLKEKEKHQSPIKDDCGQEREKSRTETLSSFSKMSPAKDLKINESPTREEESAEVVEKGILRRSSLRSDTKFRPFDGLKSPKSPKSVEETSAVEENLQRTTRSRTQFSSKTSSQSLGDSTILSTTKASKMSLNDSTVENTFSSTQMTDGSNFAEITESSVSSQVAEVSTDKEKPAFNADKRQTNPRIQENVSARDTCPLRGGKTVAYKSQSDSQSPQFRSRGPEVVTHVKVQLQDCRRMCVGRNRPVLERQSDESETESIQWSSEENYSQTKDMPNNGTSSGEEGEEISSTPTLDPCPSSPSSEKSGYSDERGGYSLRKRAERQQEEKTGVTRRTRSNYKISSEELQKAGTVARERRKTVPFPYTSVRTKSPKQRCNSLRTLGNSTPEKKKVKKSKAMKSPLNESPQRKVPRKEPSSESESNVSSESPRSGPIREARDRLTPLAVCNLSTARFDRENTEALSLLSETTASFGNLSTVAICGTPRHSNPADLKRVGHCPKTGETLLSETELLKQEGSQSATFLDKDRPMEPKFSRLFDSDDEPEDFYGFHVPQFDRSFSSEGDLSYKINSIVESMSQVDEGQGTIDDVENVTIQKDDTETEISENEQENGAKTIDEREIIRQERIYEKVAEPRTSKVYERKVTRKRKSVSPIESVIADLERVQSYSRCEGQRVGGFSADDSSFVEDVDEDDDVFSAVSDSSEGEEDEVSSPLSITSWRKKRKSEDLQPEIDRPAKRRRPQERWSELSLAESSVRRSMSETPVQSKPGVGQIRKKIGNKQPSGLKSKLDEMLGKGNKKRVKSLSSISEFYDIDEPVFQTLEERVKLRRLRKISRKAREGSSSSEQNQNIDTPRKSEAKTKPSTPKQDTSQKEVMRLQTASPRTDSSSKAKSVAPLRSSSRLNRAKSSSGVSESPLTALSGKPRRSTWIDDLSAFASPPLELPGVRRKRFRCSTPASADHPKHSLRLRVRDKVESRNAKQKDPFAFDE